MMPKSLRIAVVLPLFFLLPGLAAKPAPWTHLNFADDATEFQFAIVSDRAANPREGVFKAALKKLKFLRPRFVMSVGDFIHGYGEGFKPLTDEAAIREKRQQVDSALAELPMPFFRVAGNHDYNSDASAKVWQDLYGPVYYSFEHKGVLFLCLNSQDGANYQAGIGEEQIAWVKQTLADHANARWVCLFLHQPLWLEDAKRLEQNPNASLTGFDQVEKLLVGRQYTVFAGHHHRYVKAIKNGDKKYFKLATTGGQSPLAGPEAGTFDQIMWVTMTKDGPVIANLLLDGILDEDAKQNLPE